MCTTSLRGIMWRAALAALGSVSLAVCMRAAPVPYLDPSTKDDALRLMLTIVERSVNDAAGCAFHQSNSNNPPDGFFACAERVLHTSRTLASDNGAEGQMTDASTY
jgi:hypothetical protein